MNLPAKTDIVIIGGGIVGASIAYRLAELGLSEVCLLERGQLTCGTTWHAAGLVAELRASAHLTRLARYSHCARSTTLTTNKFSPELLA